MYVGRPNNGYGDVATFAMYGNFSLPSRLPERRNAGIKITHGAIVRFFAPQGRHVPPIMAKFCTLEETTNPRRRGKFHVDRSTYTQKTSKIQNFANLFNRLP